MPLKLPHPLEYLFKGHKGSLQSWIYGLNHSMGNRTEFSRMKGRSSGYSEGLLYSWDGSRQAGKVTSKVKRDLGGDIRED